MQENKNLIKLKINPFPFIIFNIYPYIIESKYYSLYFKFHIKSYLKLYFLKIMSKKNILKFNYLYFFKKIYLLKSFLSYLNFFFLRFAQGFLAKIKVKTYFFRIFSSINFLYLDMRSSHLYEFMLPNGFFVFTKKRRLILFTLNKYIFKNTIKNILNLKPFNIYTGKGLHLKRSRFKKKKGKIR